MSLAISSEADERLEVSPAESRSPVALVVAVDRLMTAEQLVLDEMVQLSLAWLLEASLAASFLSGWSANRGSWSGATWSPVLLDFRGSSKSWLLVHRSIEEPEADEQVHEALALELRHR